MKTKILLCLCFALLLFGRSYAAETEPNNTSAQANTLALNGSNSGSTPTTDVDWFKVTTNADGALNLTLTSTNGINVTATLYDNDGVTSLNSQTTAGTTAINTDGLAAGTYYVRINTYYSNQTGNYTIANTLVVAPVANDAEPNNTKAAALTLAQNSTTTGHINYYYNNSRDGADYYKITTDGDGLLQLKLTSHNGNNITVHLYDNDGTTELGNTTTAGTTYLNTDGLAAGTYYVQVNSYYGNQFEPYTLTDSLFKPAQANDVEPNNTKATAITLAQNSTKTGHINYYYNNARDGADYYKITTNGDGLLQLKLTSHNGSNVTAHLYDNNGTIELGNVTTTGTAYLNTDGLAAGTYYVLVNSYYSNQFEPYTLTDSLFKPAQANDTEPNGSIATALTLAQNSTKTGHINYYYNNKRDTFDFYKITTDGDGLLQLKLTSHNGNNVSAYLFDNDGITQLGTVTTTGTSYLNTDGLAAGTYYVQINSYYNTQFEPYTLTDSLYKPAQANDAEPDSSRATAITLPVNSTTTGHIGYYYNGRRDGLDFYKITTTQDGMIQLKLRSHNGNNVSAYLFDNDGITQLGTVTTAGTAYLNVDGLGAGTYYVQVNSYYSNQFEPYTLTDSLFTYSTNDPETNNRPSQARTILSNRTTTGHVGFYYNLKRDDIDWHKINYTGTSGTLKLFYGIKPNLINGSLNNVTFQVYKDTATAPISDITTANASTVVNLTGLTQGYYYIRVNSYYNSQFEAYSILDSFTQVNKASISIVSTTTSTACDSTNTITVKCSGSHSPYSVQLYRFGVAYGNPITVPNNSNFQITGLPQGSYYARAFGDGATGTAYGQSSVVNFAPPKVTGTNTTNITGNSAKTNWDLLTCVKYYTVQYHKAGDATWLPLNTTGNVPNLTLSGLLANTTYWWRVQAVDSANAQQLRGAFSDSLSFTTTAGGGSSLPDTLEAEDAVLSGAVVNNNQPGYTGTGFADYVHASGDYIEWTFNATTAGSYSLKFRYANGSTADRPLQLTVNGTVVNASLSFSPTGGWSTWSVSASTANLVAGVNKIRLTTNGANGANVDHLVIDKVASPVTLEAEDAVLSGAIVNNNQLGYTGTGFADYVHASGDYVEWTYNAPTAGSYSLQFRYANGSTSRPMQLTVNGAVINASQPFGPTGSFATWSVSPATATLVAGVNKIRLTTNGSNGPNVDNVTIDGGGGSLLFVQRPILGKGELSSETPGSLKALIKPNPVVVNNARLTVSTASNLPVSFQLIDMMGRTYQSSRLVKSGSNTFDFSVQGLPAGAYTIVVKQGSETTYTRFVVGAH